jgi:WD40 repeat protein
MSGRHENQFLEESYNKFELYTFEYFTELRRLMDSQKEQLIASITSICEQMQGETRKIQEYFQKLHKKQRDLLRQGDTRTDNQMKKIDVLRKRVNYCQFKPNLGFTEKSFGSCFLDTTVKRLVSCSESTSQDENIEILKVWGIEEGELNKQVSAEDHAPARRLFKLGNRLLASECSGEIYIRDMETGECKQVNAGGIFSSIYNVVIEFLSKEGRMVAASLHEVIHVYDVNDGTRLYSLLPRIPNRDDKVNCLLAFSNQRLASGSCKGSINIWDLDQRKCIAQLKGHTGPIECLHKLDNGTLASGSADTTIKIWNMESQECLVTLVEHTRHVLMLVTTRDGHIASCSADKSIKIWNTQTWKCIKTLIGLDEPISHLKSYHNLLISGSAYGNIKIWDMNDYTCVQTFKAHDDSLNGLQLV